MDHLMNTRASAAFGKYIARIPLTASPSIIIGNALTADWKSIVPKEKLSYILGNPPFLGARIMDPGQKADLVSTFDNLKNCSNLDYVTCWYKKAAQYMQGTAIEAAFVSTNSICQGEQVPILWPYLMQRYGVIINFAYQTFKWQNEAKGMAAVYCVIIGFGTKDRKEKELFHFTAVTSNPVKSLVSQINAYLIDAPSIFIDKKSSPICGVPEMVFGNMPNDGGYYLLTEEERETLIKEEPDITKVIRPFMGAVEFINNIPKYCIWLNGIPPEKHRNIKAVQIRIEKVKSHRQSSAREATRKLAEFPTIFGEIRQPETDYLFIPRVSSERRRYIPIGFMSKKIIAGDTALVLPSAGLYEFGILTSAIHMAWMSYVGGRLKSDYRYSASIVYNNFPWPSPATKQKERIEKEARIVLETRDRYPDSSLADLYDPNTMPPALVKAHQKLDKAVEAAYGKTFTNDADRVAHLFYLYQTLTEGLIAKKARRRNI
jgi:hypothetical protein